MNKQMHEVVGVFSHLNGMEDTIGALEVNGFNRRDISVLGNQKALKKIFGTKIPNVKELEDNAHTPKSVNITGEELGIAQGVLIGGGLLAGVTAVALAAGAGLATGSVVLVALCGTSGAAIGGFLAKMLGEKYAEFFQKQIDSGGLLLWVRTHSKADEMKVSALYKEHGARDVHVHSLA